MEWRETAEELREQYKAEGAVVRRKRLQALWLVRRGDGTAEAERMAGVGVRTVERWLGWYRTGGPDARPVVGGWGWGFAMAFGMLMTLAFWAALILGAVLLVRWAIGHPSQAMGRPRQEDPLEIPRRRYADGGIDQATYQRMKTELEDDAGIAPRQTVGADSVGR